MKHSLSIIFAGALIAAALPSIAQQVQLPSAQSGAAAFAEGEVRKIDKAAGKITLKHGEIKSLDMPPMTMVFGVKDTSMLDQVKAGEKVRFRASNDGGSFTVTELQAIR